MTLCYLKQYATTIAITLGNLLLPSCFYYLSLLEQYDPKHQLMVDLIRNIVTRLMGLMVIIGGHIQTNKWEQHMLVLRTVLDIVNVSVANMSRPRWMDRPGLRVTTPILMSA